MYRNEVSRRYGLTFLPQCGITDLIFTLRYAYYTIGFSPDLLCAVFAQIYEDGVQMGEAVKHLYADFAQKLCYTCLDKAQDKKKGGAALMSPQR